MKKQLFFLLLFSSLTFIGFGQCPCISNGAMDGTKASNIPPPSWVNCNGTADIYDGSSGYGAIPPYQGSAYLHMFNVAGNNYEDVSQPLCGPAFTPGKTYTVEFAAAMDAGADWPGDLELYGGSANCAKTELFGTVNIAKTQSSWMVVKFTFTPTAAHTSITFSVKCPTCKGALWKNETSVLIDDFKFICNDLTLTGDSVCADSCTNLVAKIEGGTPPFKFTWDNGIPSDSGMADSAVHNVCPTTTTTYTVVVVDSTGASDTASYTVRVNPKINLSPSVTHTICGLNNGAATIAVNGGTQPYQYQWSTSPPDTNTVIDSLAAGTYTILVTDSARCIKDTTVIINPSTGPKVTIFDSVNVSCNGYTNGSATAAGTLGVPAYTYSWSPPPANSSTDSIALNLPAGSYTVTLTDQQGCTVTDSVTITEPPGMLLSLDSTDANCGQADGAATVTSSGGTSPYTYSWSTTPVAQTGSIASAITAGMYTVTVTDSKTCTKTGTIVLNDIPGPVANFTANSQCVNTLIDYTDASTSVLPITKWTWDFGDASTSATQNATHAYTTADTFAVWLRVETGKGCVDSTKRDIIAYPMPVADFDADTTEGCEPLSVKFNDLSTITPGNNTYRWSFGDNGSDNTASPSHLYTVDGTYDVRLVVISSYGCADTLIKPAYIVVHPKPDPAFTADPTDTEILAPKISFYDMSVNAASWLWNFGTTDSADTSSLQNPVYTYADTGKFIVKLIATSQYGCVDSVQSIVIIRPEFEFYVPNAFTPNGDTKNETFGGYGVGIKEYDFYIFDRWGNQLFHTDGLYNFWDGKVQNGSGELVPEDTYVYWIRLTDIRGKRHTYAGGVTVIR